jgi:RNA polymerase sigma factor (sigma-70 family)
MQPGHLNEADLPGNPDATLYDRYSFTIFSYIRLHIPSREDAEDLTVEVFAAALERDNLLGLSEQEQLAWLRHVARNKLVDSYRRQSHHTLVAFDKIEELVKEYSDSDPEYLLLQQEEYAYLRKMVSKLSTLQQQVLHLRFSAELTFAEIAILLNKREDAVRKVLSRALAFLRTSYSERTR